MFKLYIVLISLIGLYGCVSLESQRDQINNLVGQPVIVAIQYFGEPLLVTPEGEVHHYYWKKNLKGVATISDTATFTTYHYDYQCMMDIQVNQAKIITELDYDGAPAGCRLFYDAIVKSTPKT